MQPSLDESKERFTYGRPDAQLIRNFCLEKFGWNFEKVDEILDPVLKVGCLSQAAVCFQGMCVCRRHYAKSSILQESLLFQDRVCWVQAYDARQAQATMDSFLAFNERFAKIKYGLPLAILQLTLPLTMQVCCNGLLACNPACRR